MKVHVNMSKEVFEYYQDYDLNEVVNTLLELYDFTNLPPMQGERAVERCVEVTNTTYISLYMKVGPRSKKVSLGRLLHFGSMTDVLSTPYFKNAKRNPTIPPPRTAQPLKQKALLLLQEAYLYDPSDRLKQITQLLEEEELYGHE